MKKIRYTLFPLLLVIPLVACQHVESSSIHSSEIVSSVIEPQSVLSSNIEESSSLNEIDGFTFAPISDELVIHSDLVNNYFKQEEYDYSKMDAAINAKTDLGDNLPIKLSFEWTGSPQASSYKISISETNNNKVVFEETTEKGEIDFINYKIGQSNYTLKVIPVVNGKDKGPYTNSFSIPNGYFRTITVDGVNNFRDLGDGINMKQGLIYRSATFENNTSANEDHPLNITEEGKKQIAPLGLVSEIDLRKDDEKTVTDKSYLNLNYFKAPLHYGGQNILTYKNSEFNNPETIKSIFEFLGDENNYPVNFHCVRGTDRTGCLAYLIKGLLGIEEEMLYRDFLFSNFYNIGSPVKLESIYYATNPNATTRYVNVIKQADGDTLKDKIFNYLSSDKVGVPTSTLDSIINYLKA